MSRPAVENSGIGLPSRSQTRRCGRVGIRSPNSNVYIPTNVFVSWSNRVLLAIKASKSLERLKRILFASMMMASNCGANTLIASSRSKGFSPCEKSEGRERRGREEGSCSANLFEFGVEYREVRKSGQLTRNQRGTVVSIVVVDFLSEDN